MRAYLTAVLLALAFSAGAQSLQTTLKNIRAIHKASFTEIVKCKFSFQDDFSVDTFKTHIAIVSTEPQIGGYYKIAGKKDTYLFDGNKAIWLNYRDTTYKMQQEYWVGAQFSRTLPVVANQLEKYLKTPANIKQMADTVINQKAYTHYFIRQTDSLRGKDHIYTYVDIIVNKTTALPFIIRNDSQGLAGDGAVMGFFEQHTFKDYRLNEKNFPDLAVAVVPPGFKLPAKRQRLAMLAAGTPAPSLRLKDMAGKDFDMASLQGKMVLLNFTIDGCPHCVNAAQMLTRLNDQYKNKGLAIVSIYQSNIDNPKTINRFDTKFNVKYPSYLTNGSAAGLYHINGYPNFYLLDKKGTIVQAYEGFYAGLEKEIADKLLSINE